MKVLGIDEAGRGALVGPLVVGGFMIDESRFNDLKEQGVRDSKELTPEQRTKLYDWLIKQGDYHYIKITPQEIDLKNKVGTNLNKLEINKMIKIINKLRPDQVIIDCPSRNTQKVTSLFKARVECNVICECKADAKYPIVGAGSIIAKYNRDNSIKLLEKELGTIIGAGYPSDERTINFARQALNNNSWRQYLRRTWSTYSRLKNEIEQRTLNDF